MRNCFNGMYFFYKKSTVGAVTREWSETLATQDRSVIKNEIIAN